MLTEIRGSRPLQALAVASAAASFAVFKAENANAQASTTPTLAECLNDGAYSFTGGSISLSSEDAYVHQAVSGRAVMDGCENLIDRIVKVQELQGDTADTTKMAPNTVLGTADLTTSDFDAEFTQSPFTPYTCGKFIAQQVVVRTTPKNDPGSPNFAQVVSTSQATGVSCPPATAPPQQNPNTGTGTTPATPSSPETPQQQPNQTPATTPAKPTPAPTEAKKPTPAPGEKNNPVLSSNPITAACQENAIDTAKQASFGYKFLKGSDRRVRETISIPAQAANCSKFIVRAEYVQMFMGKKGHLKALTGKKLVDTRDTNLYEYVTQPTKRHLRKGEYLQQRFTVTAKPIDANDKSKPSIVRNGKTIKLR